MRPGATAGRPDGRNSGIHLLTGPPNSGKLGWVMRWWLAYRERSPLVVVPSRPDAAVVLLELLERAGAVLGDDPVITFETLSELMLAPASPVEVRLLGGLEEELVWSAALERAELEALSYLRDVPGGARAVGSVLKEIEEGALGASEAKTALERWAKGSGTGDSVAADICRIYEQYRHLCGERRVVAPSFRVRSAAQTGTTWRRPVACYGFNSFTPVQRALLLSLSESVPVVVTLPYEEGRAAARAVAAECEEWQAHADEWERLPAQTTAYSSLQLAYLERAFMQEGDTGAPPQAAFPPQAHCGEGVEAGNAPPSGGSEPGEVRVLVSAGRRHEAELVLQETVQLLRSGFRPADIALLVRSTAPWSGLLQRVFDSAHIPLRMDAQVEFGHTGLGHALIQACRSALEGTDAGVRAFLRTPYHELPPSQVDLLERSFSYSPLEDTGFLGAVSSLPPEAARLRRVLTPLASAPLKPEHLSVLAAHMFECALPHLEAGGGFGRRRLECDAKALRVLDDALESLVATDHLPVRPGSSPGWTPARFLQALAHLSVWLPDGSAEGVRVMTVARAHATRFRAVFVLGLVESEFPRTGDTNGLLPAAARARANEHAGVSLFREPPEGEEAFLFWLALSRPWELLYLSTRDTDEEGAAEVLSPFLEEACRITGSDRPHSTRGLARVVHDVDAAPGMREYLRACVAGGTRPVGLDGSSLPRSWSLWPVAPTACSSPAVLEELASRTVFSASELEDYCTCPFMWFVSRILAPQELPEEWSHREAGSAAHRVLDLVFKELMERRLLPLSPSHLEEALAIAASRLEQTVPSLTVAGRSGESLLLQKQVEGQVQELLRREAEADRLFVVSETERRLVPAVEIAPGVSVGGKVDRIDRHLRDGGAFIIDYKLGGGSHTPFARTGALQIPLYMRCLAEIEPAHPVWGGAYVSLRDGSGSGYIHVDRAGDMGGWLPARAAKPAGEMWADVEECVQLATEAAAGIRQGLIPAKPREECPWYCRAAALCGVSRKRGGR